MRNRGGTGSSIARLHATSDSLLRREAESDGRNVNRARSLVLLIILILFALLLRILFAQIFFSPDDDVFYLRDAYLMSHGHFVHNTHWALRLGVVAPTAVFIRIFGFHDWSVILYPLCIALLGIPLIYAFGRALFNAAVGFIAAFLLACFPEHIYYSTLVMADLPGAFWGALAVFFAFRSRGAMRASRIFITCGASGLALAMSYFCWEVNLIFVPICCLMVIWRVEWQGCLFRMGLIVSFILLALGAESVFYWELTGDPLLRWNVASNAGATINAVISPLAFVIRVPRILLLPTRRQFFLYSWLCVWALFYLHRQWRQTEVQLLAVWLMGFLVVIGYSIYSLHPLRALLDINYVRYFDDLTYPAILLIAKALYETRPARGAVERRSDQ